MPRLYLGLSNMHDNHLVVQEFGSRILMETNYPMMIASIMSAVTAHRFSSVSLASRADRVNLRLYK